MNKNIFQEANPKRNNINTNFGVSILHPYCTHSLKEEGFLLATSFDSKIYLELALEKEMLLTMMMVMILLTVCRLFIGE